MGDLDTRSCSCRLWQSCGYPCSHALAIILSLKEDPQVYAEKFYTLESYRKVYQNAIIHPLTHNYCQLLSYQEIADQTDDHDNEESIVLPPSTKRPPGRPPKRCIPSQIRSLQRIIHCSRCGQAGHNQKKCTEPLE